eukprot:4770718-Pyramimonas_sp.AAC.1
MAKVEQGRARWRRAGTTMSQAEEEEEEVRHDCGPNLSPSLPRVKNMSRLPDIDIKRHMDLE